MKLEQFIEEEIKFVNAPQNGVPRMKRKTVVEYLIGRLKNLSREGIRISEAEALILKASRDKLHKHASENPIKKPVQNKRKDTDVYDLEKNIPNT
jgi:hypothetical protein